MLKRLNHNGFTLIETIVTLAILSVLVGFVAPQVVSLIDRAKLSTDHSNVRELNSSTAVYRILNSSNDPFLDPSKSDAELMQVLVDAEQIRALISPRTTDAQYTFDKTKLKWFLSINDVFIPPIVYLLTSSDFTVSQSSSTTLVQYTNAVEKNIQIPEGIRTIGGGLNTSAFFERGLESVILPNSLIEIRSHGFYGNNLVEIEIPSNVTHIRTQSFYNNPITTITINREPGQIIIESRAFGSGYSEANIITEAFKSAFAIGGSGTYILNGTTWIKTD
jgi:prepilin-type N-terminal cleavage/methylation domain-containing protein